MSPPDGPARILIVRPSALGDVCRTVPVLVSLRRAFPDAQIDWLVNDAYAEAIGAHPALSGVIPFPRSQLSPWGTALVRSDLWRMLRTLRRPRYDVVLDCQGLARSALLALATGSRRRLGYRDAPEFAPLLYTERVDAPRAMHTVDRMLRLAAAVGAPPVPELDLVVPPPAERWAASAAPGRFVLLAPTARWPGKRWAADRFAELARRLLADASLALDAVRVVGTRAEAAQCPALVDLGAREPRLITHFGATGVGQLMGLVARAALVVANDSAALHIAVGLRRPLVGLFGPTRTALVGPYGRSSDVLQHVDRGERLDHKDAALGARLMDRISTDEVFAACAERLVPPVRVPRPALTGSAPAQP